MSVCKHRVMDKCKKYDRPCIFNTDCFEPEEEKRMTNADLIRAMTDEELARFFIGDSPNYCHPGLCLDGETCIGCFLKWLQQPAEDIANG